MTHLYDALLSDEALDASFIAFINSPNDKLGLFNAITAAIEVAKRNAPEPSLSDEDLRGILADEQFKNGGGGSTAIRTGNNIPIYVTVALTAMREVAKRTLPPAGGDVKMTGEEIKAAAKRIRAAAEYEYGHAYPNFTAVEVLAIHELTDATQSAGGETGLREALVKAKEWIIADNSPNYPEDILANIDAALHSRPTPSE